MEAINNAPTTFKVYPIFIYWITGCYPDDIESYKYNNSSADAGSINRSVTFAFNNMHLLTRYNCSSYGASDLFQGIDVKYLIPTIPEKRELPKNKDKEKRKKLINYVRDLEFGKNAEQTARKSSNRFIKWIK